jgi:hypothetical protein
VLAVTVVLVAASVAGRSTTGSSDPPVPSPVAEPVTPTVWGVAGPLRVDPPTARAQGVMATILELEWRKAEPSAGVWDEIYFAQQRLYLQQLRAAGIEVVLNTGMQMPPDWALDLPGARFRDQFGTSSGPEAGLNLVWNTKLRPVAGAYLRKVFAELGVDFTAVRVGGGELGELTYPRTAGSPGSYWAFDDSAARSNPVPGWRPGTPQTASGEARLFLDWYLAGLADYQNWQIAQVRAAYPGRIAVLYPDVAIDEAGVQVAEARNLDGTSPAEAGRRLQAGQDHARLIGALADAQGVAAWCTWANKAFALAPVAAAARSRGIAVMGENSGDETTREDLRDLASNAREQGLALVVWVRYDDLVSGAAGAATLADLEAVRRGAEGASPSTTPPG